ncbi:protein DA1-related 2-like [Andrographis paniculata]|uniref:protein DA1-related 2-like n=1 Tax=Andrographis paniculata TaxID=175694 RepID=UPI0021E8693A|nr:protein DA1-related 2-like [Andrographis paniculata]XP_051120019.1 protein DA1-related 2-like [Andrographis paniculata]XP_051120020.1 protein DA1-related 2-like [Andrographis paniculata]
MSWLNKLFRSGANSSSRGVSFGPHQPRLLRDDDMVCGAPFRPFVDDRARAHREFEELDRAIALSLSEDLKRPNGHRRRMDLDEDLPRSLHDRINSEPFYPYAPAPLREQYHRGYRICGGCNREIRQGSYLSCMGTFFHPECFRCHGCGNPIREHEFSLSGKDVYHKSCFKELTHPKCEVCHRYIPMNSAGLIEYRCHPFWSQKYCPSHEYDHTVRCSSCERLESRDTKYISLGDGRSLCLECLESAIMDTGECQPLYHSIRDFYEGLNMRIGQEITMLLVERQALNDALEGEKHGIHHMPETRGLCLSEEQTVSSIYRRPRMDRRGLVGMRTQPQRLIRRSSEVTAILVLFGLPRLLTGAILAHELMHAWLRLNDFRNLRPEVEEGICQVLSHMWLESEVLPVSRNMPSSSTWQHGSAGVAYASSSTSRSTASKKGGKSSMENKLGEFFLQQIEHDTSPAYGGGYRAAMAAVNLYGLRSTLNHIRHTGMFPE